MILWRSIAWHQICTSDCEVRFDKVPTKELRLINLSKRMKNLLEILRITCDTRNDCEDFRTSDARLSIANYSYQTMTLNFKHKLSEIIKAAAESWCWANSSKNFESEVTRQQNWISKKNNKNKRHMVSAIRWLICGLDISSVLLYAHQLNSTSYFVFVVVSLDSH